LGAMLPFQVAVDLSTSLSLFIEQVFRERS
jgi:hypothetical protein